MPPKGFSSIQLPNELIEEMKAEADKSSRSLPKYIEYIFKEMQKDKEKRHWFVI